MISTQLRKITLLLLLGLLVALVGQPQEVQAGIYNASNEVTYKEYWVPHSEFTGGCGDNEKPYGSWYLEPYGCEKTLNFQIPDDFSGALKAEIYVDLWRNYEGKLARFVLNNKSVHAPNVGAAWSRTPYVDEVPLSELRQGNNTILFQKGGYHVHDIGFRIYYDATHPLLPGSGSDVKPPDGSLLTIKGDGSAKAAGAGGNLDVDGNELTLTANVSDGASYVEFHAYYFGMDENTDGKWLDWHNRGHNNWFPGGTGVKATGGVIDHPGTVATPGDGQYSVNWDVSAVPDQDDVKFKIRVVDAAGNVREAAGGDSANFSLSRTKPRIAFWDPDFDDIGLWMEGSKPPTAKRGFWMPFDFNPDDYESAMVQHSFWHRATLLLNDSSNSIWPIFPDDDMWQMSATTFSPSLLWPGNNKLNYAYNNPGDNRPGAFVEKPGPFFVLEHSTWTFDDAPPSSYNLLPENGASNVGPGTLIRAQIVDHQSGLDYSTLVMKVQGQVVAHKVSGAKHSAMVWYRPPVAFQPNEEVEVKIDICDLDGQCNTTTFNFDVEGESLPTGIDSDDFNSCTLNNSVWDFRDPVGNSSYLVNGKELEITVPAGTNHEILDNANESARIMQAINDEDFRMSAKFDAPVEAGTQMQGLLVAEDEQNFVRYNLIHNGSAVFIEAYIYEDGERLQSPKLIKQFDASQQYVVPTHLAIEKFGNTWRFLYMDESEQWVTLKTFDDNMSVSEAGVFAGNKGNPASAAPEFTSKVDYFFDDNAPIDPQDQNPLNLPVEVVGQGSVDLSPVCGNPTTLTATAGEGYFFKGWTSASGTISGRTNPLQTSFIAGEMVTATFVLNQLTLDVQVDNDGTGEGGTVDISPDQQIYEFEDMVTLTPDAPFGWEFKGWSGDVKLGDENDNPLVIVMDDNLEITASFAALPVTLDVETTGMGSVQIDPDQSGDYQYGDFVTLTAVPVEGWVFDKWEGDVQGPEQKNPAVFELTEDTEVTAVFKERPPWVFLPFIVR